MVDLMDMEGKQQLLITHMLGLRREGVKESAQRLQMAGPIRCSPGHVQMLDRPWLERLSCERCVVDAKEHDRFLRPAQAKEQWLCKVQNGTVRQP